MFAVLDHSVYSCPVNKYLSSLSSGHLTLPPSPHFLKANLNPCTYLPSLVFSHSYFTSVFSSDHNLVYTLD